MEVTDHVRPLQESSRSQETLPGLSEAGAQMWTRESECQQIRISFQARVRFAGIPRVTKDGLVGGFWLKHRIESPRFTRVEFLPPSSDSRFPIRRPSVQNRAGSQAMKAC